MLVPVCQFSTILQMSTNFLTVMRVSHDFYLFYILWRKEQVDTYLFICENTLDPK